MRALIRRKDDGTWQACFRRRDGSVVCVSTREADIAREIARRVAARMPPGADASGLWAGIKGVAKRIARARVLKKAAKAYRSVAGNPIVAKAVGLGVAAATGVPPHVTERLLLASASGKIPPALLAAGFATGQLQTIAAVQMLRDDPKAAASFAGAAVAAQKGNPRAQAVVAQAAGLAKRFRVLKAAGRLLEDRARAGDPVAAQMLAYAAGQVSARRGGAAAGDAGAPWRRWVPTQGTASWTRPDGRRQAVTFQLGARSRVSIVPRARAY